MGCGKVDLDERPRRDETAEFKVKAEFPVNSASISTEKEMNLDPNLTPTLY